MLFIFLDSSLPCSYSLMEFQPKVDLDFSLDMFKTTFIHLAHLLASGLSGMVLEHLWDIFDLKDSTSGFSQLFFICFYVVIGCILGSITRALGVAMPLTLTKFFCGIWPIAISKVLYQLVNMTFCLQFHDAFSTHLSPHQFGVTVRGGCEAIVHGIWATLNVHPNWMLL